MELEICVAEFNESTLTEREFEVHFMSKDANGKAKNIEAIFKFTGEDFSNVVIL